ncbi:hypothetical protein Achl_1362 [Pseudarthrobacter chlorophenolicus A6]|uniref:Transmembrane protein n=1 Tax=Pseudarthrobacter chlorophenolicus (strain ATCC 700700 / DSM 12829 / CIP 107037 / JCM 12360 / KCTC 9906 / NCIMB 13794 / A6) TaxID=452863 RepID=B8HFL3_PSECP|nr:hypothetical protein Achl_1362 [Pseudarthrobacter chlorophenolicus A6]
MRLSWADRHFRHNPRVKLEEPFERHSTVSNLFFWIIILSFVIPMAMRMYRKSVAKRNHDQSFQGRYPDQFPGAGQYPGNQFPGGQFPGSAGPQSKQPRDGYTQQDYFSGGYRQIGQQAPPSRSPDCTSTASRRSPARAGSRSGRPRMGSSSRTSLPTPRPAISSPGTPHLNSRPHPPLPCRRRPRRASGRGSWRNWMRSTATANCPWRTTWPAAAKS